MRRERVDELRRRDALVVDVLPVEAELVAVIAAHVGEVVDHLPDVLLEVEAGVALSGVGERSAECHGGDS